MNLPVAGGGYFRILPYWWTRWGIDRLNRLERLPAIFYLHPWEIDPEQPRLPATGLSRFRHYRHLDKTEPRLRQLLTDFRFVTVSEVVRSAARPATDVRSAARSVSRDVPDVRSAARSVSREDAKPDRQDHVA